MSQMTDFLENKLVDFLFRQQAFIPSATLYISLHTANPTDAGSFETTGSGYARATVASSLLNWKSTQNDSLASTGNTGQTSNSAAITFGSPGVGGWGTVTHFAIWDAATGGNAYMYGALTITKTINQADTLSFAIGAITVTLA